MSNTQKNQNTSNSAYEISYGTVDDAMGLIESLSKSKTDPKTKKFLEDFKNNVVKK